MMNILKNINRLILSIMVFVILSFQLCFALTINSDLSTVDFGSVTKEILDNGFIEDDASTSDYALRLTVDDPDTMNWTINTKSSIEYFSSTFGTKPSSDLQWRINGTGIYSSITTTDDFVASGSGNAIVDIDLKLLTDWYDVPSDYSIDVIFTITEDL